jgi:acyl-CoA thioesterase FadM
MARRHPLDCAGTLASVAGFVSRWPVRQEHRVAAADLDADGAVRDGVVRRWVEAACTEHLANAGLLPEPAGLRVRHGAQDVPSGRLLGRLAAVAVSAGVREVRPDSFVVAVRLRPLGGDRELALNATLVIELEDLDGRRLPIDDALRDVLIALEHAAQYTN